MPMKNKTKRKKQVKTVFMVNTFVWAFQSQEKLVIWVLTCGENRSENCHVCVKMNKDFIAVPEGGGGRCGGAGRAGGALGRGGGARFGSSPCDEGAPAG